MKIPKDRKMTFVEFVAALETYDGTIDESCLEHWKKHIPNMINEVHGGDCTKCPSPCSLCVLEQWLKEYREYTFEKVEDELRGI